MSDETVFVVRVSLGPRGGGTVKDVLSHEGTAEETARELAQERAEGPFGPNEYDTDVTGAHTSHEVDDWLVYVTEHDPTTPTVLDD